MGIFLLLLKILGLALLSLLVAAVIAVVLVGLFTNLAKCDVVGETEDGKTQDARPETPTPQQLQAERKLTREIEQWRSGQ